LKASLGEVLAVDEGRTQKKNTAKQDTQNATRNPKMQEQLKTLDTGTLYGCQHSELLFLYQWHKRPE
jgi:hypothetical protein